MQLNGKQVGLVGLGFALAGLLTPVAVSAATAGHVVIADRKHPTHTVSVTGGRLQAGVTGSVTPNGGSSPFHVLTGLTIADGGTRIMTVPANHGVAIGSANFTQIYGSPVTIGVGITDLVDGNCPQFPKSTYPLLDLATSGDNAQQVSETFPLPLTVAPAKQARCLEATISSGSGSSGYSGRLNLVGTLIS